jgi:rhodanese-related sulfurtransferase
MDFEIMPGEVQALRERGEDFLLLDVREAWEVQTAQIAGSTHIPMGDIPMHVPELDADQHIVVVCHHGVRSLNVTHWLRQQGFENVQSMRGGIDLWSKTIDPKVPVY